MGKRRGGRLGDYPLPLGVPLKRGSGWNTWGAGIHAHPYPMWVFPHTPHPVCHPLSPPLLLLVGVEEWWAIGSWLCTHLPQQTTTPAPLLPPPPLPPLLPVGTTGTACSPLPRGPWGGCLGTPPSPCLSHPPLPWPTHLITRGVGVGCCYPHPCGRGLCTRAVPVPPSFPSPAQSASLMLRSQGHCERRQRWQQQGVWGGRGWVMQLPLPPLLLLSPPPFYRAFFP